ncbi:MAG: prepilin peptidase [Hominimerdicola sp.]
MDTGLILCYIAIYAFAFLFGVCIGSFLNVCIYRLPKGESLIKSNSHCMTCGEPIKRRDLIPIISWCILRGKCRNCKAKIAARYTIVEALTGLLFLLVCWHFDPVMRPTECILNCLLFAALVVVFFMDWDTQLINTGVVIFIGLLAIPEYLLCKDYTGLTLKSMIIGALIVSIPLLIVVLASHERAMGMGDAYLMAAAGLFLGMQNTLVAFVIALITGSIGGLIQKHRNGDSVFAFGPYLSIGIAVAVLYGDKLADWYMKFTGLAEMLA